MFTETIKDWKKLFELPRHINIHGANINVDFVFTKKMKRLCVIHLLVSQFLGC